jgi:tetratricopeptide (TPR) repeat protein
MRYLLGFFIVVLGLALFVLGAWGRAEESPLPLFEQGNVAYQKGDFVAARDLYEKTVAEGWGGAALFYNLGNTYFRLGQWGRARLWYERAWREDRRDEDIRYNRDLVRRQVGDMEEGTDRVIGWSGVLWGVTGLVQLIFFGGLMWGAGITYLGYFLGNSIPNIDSYLMPVTILIVILSFAPGIIHYLSKKENRTRITDIVKNFYLKLKP